MQGAHVVSDGVLGGVSGEMGDQAVAAHADRTVDPGGGHIQAHLMEGELPGHGVVVDRVDQGSVEVEDDGVDAGSTVSWLGHDSWVPSPAKRMSTLNAPRVRAR